MRVFLIAALLLFALPTASSAAPDLCTPTRAKAIEQTGVIVRKAEKEIFVTPYIWSRLSPDAQVTLTVWAARCLLDTRWIAVKHVHSEAELARWSESLGFKAAP